MDFLFSYMYIATCYVALQLAVPFSVDSKLGAKICAAKLLDIRTICERSGYNESNYNIPARRLELVNESCSLCKS